MVFKEPVNVKTGVHEDPFFNWVCDRCGTVYNALEAGKVRMGNNYCTVECADKAHPEFIVKPRERNRKKKP